MRRRGWTLGGEQSGHIIASDFVATGDGIAAALMTMRELGGAPLADAVPMEKLPQTLVNVEVADREAIAGAAAVWEAVEREGDGARGPRPGAAAPLRHRAAGAGDGRGAERRGGRGGLRAPGRARPPRAGLSRAGPLPLLAFMCGIVGYVGGRPCEELLLAGLEKLEYRGYDSAGLSVIEDGEVDSVHAVGNLANLRAAVAERAANGAGALPPSPTPASPTPAGRPTVASPRRTPTRTTTAPARSTSSSTGSSRTTPACASGCRPRARSSPPRPTPRSSPT